MARKRKGNAPLFFEHAGVKIYRVPRWDWTTVQSFWFSLQEYRENECEDKDFDIRELPGGKEYHLPPNKPVVIELIKAAIDAGNLESYTLGTNPKYHSQTA